MTQTLFIFGCGYSGRAIATSLIAKGWRVFGTTRSQESIADLAALGIEPSLWPGDNVLEALTQSDHLLLSIAPDATGDPVIANLSDAIRAAAPFRWTGYLSTTGVYGDRDGGWVDEQSGLAPATKRGEYRVLAEKQWQDLAKRCDLRLHIFRLAGIYGPGRGPFAKVRARTARRIIKPNQVFSRVHVADIVAGLEASIAKPDPGAIYNLCDDDPAPPQDVLSYAARLLGMGPPPEEDWETAEMTPMARSFYAESKRVRNDRIKRELGLELAYPDYRTGLKALLKETAATEPKAPRK